MNEWEDQDSGSSPRKNFTRVTTRSPASWVRVSGVREHPEGKQPATSNRPIKNNSFPCRVRVMIASCHGCGLLAFRRL